MKLRQKIYDSSEQINKLIKITNSYHLYKNLEKIKNRRPIYINSYNNQKKSESRKSHNDLNDYYKKKENLIFGKILEEINAKKVKSPINLEQNKLINNSRDSRLVHNNLKKQALEKENENYKKRIYSQKAFCSAKTLEQEYNKRLIFGKSKNNNSNDSKILILPPINKY